MRYFRPSTLREALAIRGGEDVAVLAGGTDIYPAYAMRRAWGEPVHKDVLDISGIAALRGIKDRGDHVRIGALATWTELLRADLPPLFDGLKDAARRIGGAQVQNRGTMVGNACTASPAGDGIPNLLVLDAEFEIAGAGGPACVPAAAFFTGYRATASGPGDIVTAVTVPKWVGAGAFTKLGARRYLVISIAMVAAAVEVDAAGRIVSARVAVGACSPVARRLQGLESDLAGTPIVEAGSLVQSRHLAGLSPIEDVRASAGYRMAAARALVADCLDGFTHPMATRRVAA